MKLIRSTNSILALTVCFALMLTLFTACDKSGSNSADKDPLSYKFITKTRLGDGKLYTAADIASRFEGFKSLDKNTAPAIREALLGTDEAALLKQMEKDNITVLAFPTRSSAKAGSIWHRMVNAGEIDLFSWIFVGDKITLVAPTHQAFRLNDGQIKDVLTYLRAKLVNSDKAPALPKAFAIETFGEAVLDLRFSTEEGFNRKIGRVRGRGKNLQEAFDKAIKMSQNRYDKWGGGLNGGPIEDFLKHAVITVTMFRERGLMASKHRNFLTKSISLGLDGLVITLPEKTIIITPDKSKLLREEDLGKLIEKELKSNKISDAKAWEADTAQLHKFRVLEFTERQPEGEAIRLFRGVEYVSPKMMNKAEIEKSFKSGAEWLLSIFDHNTGMFKYTYWAVTDREQKRQYNLIRHNLATLTLIQGYDMYKDERYLKAAERAIEFIWDLTEFDGKTAMFRHKRFDPKYKLGGAGTFVQAVCQFNKQKRMKKWDKRLKGLGEFMMDLQKENGHYNSFFFKPGDKKSNKEVTIYPGEANLALAYLYDLFKDQRYLDTVKNAITKHYREWFNDKKNPRSKGSLGAYIPWEMTAMGEYWKLTKDDFAAEYAYEMANWVVDGWFGEYPGSVWFKDWDGAIKNNLKPNRMPPWNSGVYGEGLVSVWQIAKLRGDKKMEEKLLKVVHGNARFTRNLQYREGSSYYLPNPKAAIGCIPSSMHKDDCRLDFAYHCLTVNYRILRWFDDGDYKALGFE